MTAPLLIKTLHIHTITLLVHIACSCWIGRTGVELIDCLSTEMQYAWCGGKKPVTRADCKASCAAMNTDTETGWTLACIPTKMHNEQVKQLLLLCTKKLRHIFGHIFVAVPLKIKYSTFSTLAINNSFINSWNFDENICYPIRMISYNEEIL